MSLIYKIVSEAEWARAQASGRFEGSAVDLKDGFIHMSSADQAQETARLHFRGQADLILVSLEADDLGADLKWEPSRGGVLFPHLYGPLDVTLARETRRLTLDAEGMPRLDL
jgi:uncharacterized protein (DUF952 family)